MKKKDLIFPAITFVLSVFAGVFMLVFTTDFLYHFSLNVKDMTDIIKRAPVMEIAYKIEPSYSLMNSLSNAYNPFYMVYVDESDLKASDFTEKCVKYQKLKYDYVHDENYNFTQYNEGFFEAGYPSKDFARVRTADSYALALYANGQKEESKAVFERIASEIGPEDYHTLIVANNYIFYVHKYEKDKDFQKWMLGIEEEYSKLSQRDGNSESVDNIFAKFEELYVPFE